MKLIYRGLFLAYICFHRTEDTSLSRKLQTQEIIDYFLVKCVRAVNTANSGGHFNTAICITAASNHPASVTLKDRSSDSLEACHHAMLHILIPHLEC